MIVSLLVTLAVFCILNAIYFLIQGESLRGDNFLIWLSVSSLPLVLGGVLGIVFKKLFAKEILFYIFPGLFCFAFSLYAIYGYYKWKEGGDYAIAFGIGYVVSFLLFLLVSRLIKH